MKNLIHNIIIAVTVALTITSCYKDDIEGLQSQIDSMKNEAVALLDSEVESLDGAVASLRTADTALQSYIEALQKDGDKYAEQIAALTKMDGELDAKIAQLEAKTISWANSTFTTLAQLDSLNAVVSTIPGKIAEVSSSLDKAKAELVAGYGKAISEAVTASESKLTALIEALETRLGKVEGEVATITEQIKSINTTIDGLKALDATLQGYISDLKKDGDKHSDQIAALEAMDKTIKCQIEDLQTYVDKELKNTKDWASATFATLSRMDSLCSVVAPLPSQIEAVSQSLETAKTELQTAVTALETSMKQWVNGRLDGYYTIAQIDAKLDSLAKAHDGADKALKDSIAQQKKDLAAAKDEITKAYQTAITTAIETLDGKLTTKIASDIATVNKTLQDQIDAITQEITAIKGRLDKAEADIKALIDQIQSVVVIPDYADGSVAVRSGDADISFDIRPVKAAEALAKAWADADDAGRAKMIGLTIKEVQTKADASEAALASIGNVTFENGEFKLEAYFRNLPKAAMVSLKIQNGKSELASKYFPLDIRSSDSLLAFEAVDGSATISLSDGENGQSFEYSFDGLSWKTLAFETNITFTPGQKLYVRNTEAGGNELTKACAENNYKSYHFNSTGKYNLSGKIAYLMDRKGEQTEMSADGVFMELFINNGVVDASALVLPETTNDKCYMTMFGGCAQLAAAPALPAKTLAKKCYYAMFTGCTALKKAPVLPAETAVEGCYQEMFSYSGVREVRCALNDLSASKCTNNWLISVPANGIIIADGAADWYAHRSVSGLPENWNACVDLGLTSGTLWAITNVGATTCTGYGNYYAWGECDPKTSYSWSNYKWCAGSASRLNKYCAESTFGKDGFTDTLTELVSDDDVATKLWGGSWEMPTITQLNELTDDCTWTWYPVGNSTFNGVAGYKVQGKKAGYTDHSVFLPAAGSKVETSSNGVDTEGYYWSKTLCTNGTGGYTSKAHEMKFDSDNIVPLTMDRCSGLSVRPVAKL